MRKLGVAFGLLLSFNAFAEYGVNMTEGVTSVSHDIYGLHMMVSKSINTFDAGTAIPIKIMIGTTVQTNSALVLS
jgi:hypothetical protein